MDNPARQYLTRARVARLATADADGRPHVVPVCFVLTGGELVTPIDEKPKAADPSALRRVRHVRVNPRVALVADRYREDWSELGWVQVRGTASVLGPADNGHDTAVAALRSKYDQYADHDLESRPIVRIEPGSVVSWGNVDSDAQGEGSRPDG